MKQSEIRAEAEKIIKTIFPQLAKSDEKEVWKKAISACGAQAEKNDAKVREIVATGSDEDTAKYTRNYYVWDRARFILANRFGKKFIKPKMAA